LTNIELRSPGFDRLPVGLVAGGVALLGAAAVAGRGVAPAAGVLILVSLIAAGHRVALRWDVLVSFLLLVVLVIPIKRYGFTASLPFDLEPYRIAIGFVLGLWTSALLIDSRVRLQRSAIDGPLLLFAVAVIGSVALNPGSITRLDIIRSFVGARAAEFIRDADRIPFVDVSGTVAKALLFLVSVYLAFYFIVSVVRSPQAIHVVLKTLVCGAAGVAAFAIVERRTGYNVFDHLQGWIPLVTFEGSGLDAADIGRAGRLRVYASAQHPIALAALFAMVVPLSLYLAHHRRRPIWYATSAVLILGALSTVSRTSVTMLAAIVVIFLVLRRSVVTRAAVFVLPALIVIHLILPGTIGGLRQAFFPSKGLVSDQTVYGGRISSERLGPQFDVIKQQPALGQGYGTRVTSGPEQNSRVLDNQWLATGVETGLIGVFAWVWLFVRFVRRAGSEAKRDLSERGWLLTAITSSVVAFAVGMFTFDAFSFVQELFVFFVLLALGSAVLAWNEAWPEGAAAERPDRTAALSSGRVSSKGLGSAPSEVS